MGSQITPDCTFYLKRASIPFLHGLPAPDSYLNLNSYSRSQQDSNYKQHQTMYDSLDNTISEEIVHVQGSSDTTKYVDLPPETPKVRSFADTVQRQNMENRMLREEIAPRLIMELNEPQQKLNDKDSYGDYVGRTPTQQNPVKMVQLIMTPSSPHGRSSRIPATTRRRL